MSEAEHAKALRAAVDSAEAHEQPSGARRTMHISGAVLVAVVLPVLLVGALVGQLGVGALFVGLLLGVVGSKIGGTRRMLFVAPTIGVAAGLGALTAYDWWWVALLAVVGALAGAGIGFGWFPALLMVPYAATFVVQVDSGTDAAIYGVIAAIATLYGVVLARRFGAPEVVEGDRLSPPIAAAIPVAIADPSAGVLAAVGTIAFIVALTQSKTYWLMYGLYTFALVLLLAAPGQVGFEAEERGFQILVGVGLLVVGLFIVHALGRWFAKRDPQPEFNPDM